jgi:hypothetical protein
VSVIRVEVAEPGELFVAPSYDPLSGRLERAPGIERVLRQLEGSYPERPSSLEIAAVGSWPAPANVSDIARAVAAFCRAETEALRSSIRLTRRRGLQALWIGLPALGLCLAASGLSASLLGEGGLGNLLSNSFIIAGWVALWRPTELLLYDWWPLRHRIRLLDHLAQMEIRLVGK